MNTDELLDVCFAGLTDGTISMSLPSRDSPSGEDAAGNLPFRCITISDVEVPRG